MSIPKGSQDLRAEIFEEVQPAVNAVPDKDSAISLINQNIQMTQALEYTGLSKLEGTPFYKKYLQSYETAAQLALKFHVLPEVVLGYAYRLKLLGMHSSAHALEHALEANAGLFDKELAG